MEQSARGNLPYANLHLLRETSFSKPGFIAFGSMRSYPLHQWPKIVCALRDRTLPLGETSVRTLFRMAAYQIGTLSHSKGNNDTSSFRSLVHRDAHHISTRSHAEINDTWHVQLREDSELAAELVKELQHWAARLQLKPRDHDSFLVIAEITAFAAQYVPLDLRLQLSEAATTWAEAITLKLAKKNCTPEEMLTLRARQCLFYGYAILAISAVGSCDDDAAGKLVTWIVLFNNSLVFGDDPAYSGILKNVRTSVQRAMSERISAVLRLVEKNAHLLTGAIDLIQEGTPMTLQWKRVTEGIQSTVCFEATAENGDLHTINILSGVFLLNGAPPGRLSQDIRNNPLFKRHFGDRDFEVTRRESNGQYVFRTMHAVDGHYFYEFSLREGVLVVRELRKDPQATNTFSQNLQLVDVGNNWFTDLPIRLQTMHSHWILAGQRVMVMRSIDVFNRSVQFIIHNGQCYSVTLADANCGPSDLLRHTSTMNRFIVVNSSPPSRLESVKAVMTKLEDEKYIHTLELKKTIFLDLPRLSIRFLMSDAPGAPIQSINYSGFKLANEQQLRLLPWFQHYLVLEPMRDTLDANLKLLVPNGKLLAQQDGIKVSISGCDSTSLPLHVFEWDPRREIFTSSTLTGRLQLAATLTASGSLLPEPLLHMTASEAAINTVRHCWIGRPLESSERNALENVLEHSWREPSLTILCTELLRQTELLRFLHEADERKASASTEATKATHDWRTIAVTELRSRMTSEHPDNRLRRWLSSSESSFAGTCSQPFRRWNAVTLAQNKQQNLPMKSTVIQDTVTGYENDLLQLIVEGSKGQPPVFPLEYRNTGSVFENEMIKDLRESWDLHNRAPSLRVRSDARVKSGQLASSVDANIKDLNQYIQNVVSGDLNRCPLLLMVNRAPTLSFGDLLQVAQVEEITDDHPLADLLPVMTLQTYLQFRQVVLTYLSLLVLRDRLHRIRDAFESKDFATQRTILLRELSTHHKWSVSEHPGWLVFEVEGRIQVRPEQYDVAHHLMKNPRAITQLNMGLGKTRVILPLLMIHFAGNSGVIPRVTILSALLREASEYLESHLTSSSLSIRIHQQPFCRDVKLSSKHVALIRQQLFAGPGRVCVVVAPEHRLSLELKLQELRFAQSSADVIKPLTDILTKMKFVDIFDESDELLSLRQQLVYAVGQREGLQDCTIRFTTMQALLRVVNDAKQGSDLFNVITECGKKSAPIVAGCYGTIRLNAFSNDSNPTAIRGRLRRAILEALAHDSEGDLDWLHLYLERLPSKSRESFIEYLIDDMASDVDFRDEINPSFWAYIYILRGCLAFGLLEHTLELRNRVNYGIAAKRPKKVAIPFRAADVAAQRSEFNHPDVVLLLTTLAYYQDGLERQEVLEALRMVLKTSSEPTRNFYYNRWIAPLRSELSREQFEMIQDVNTLDLSNPTQTDILFKFLRKSMTLIDFWLAKTVFAKEMSQYPKRIANNAWHLATSHYPVGFSGTNDNKHLLPLLVQAEDPVDNLRATNGLMLDCILRQTEFCDELQILDTNVEEPMWRKLARFARTGARFNALIDVGSLLAGSSNEAVARFLVGADKNPNDTDENFNKKFKGVYFFDATVHHTWMVLDTETRLVVPRSQSPIHEQDSFVLFDDARSRGSDMTMPADAIGLLTIGPSTTKDRLMQGAGRLRLLTARLQKLVIVSSDDVKAKIQSDLRKPHSGVKIRDVLQWVVGNSSKSNDRDLWMWSEQGKFYATSDGKPVDDDWRLEKLYALPTKHTTVAVAADGSFNSNSIQRQREQEVSTSQGHSRANVLQELGRRCAHYGAEVQIAVSKMANDECERELEMEEEEELEKEQEIPRQHAVVEKRWQYSTALTATSISDLATQCMSIKAAATSFIAQHHIAVLRWPHRLYCTVDFLRTVANNAPLDFLRVADVAILFNNGDVLMLSDKEADAILALVLSHRPNRPEQWRLVNVSHARTCHSDLPDDLAAAVEVLNGETVFLDDKRKAAVKALVDRGDKDTKSPVMDLVASRMRSDWSRSHLEAVYRSLELSRLIPGDRAAGPVGEVEE
ncbi:hypothetical protein M427DRAFT_285457 [Gonapodya prolifera JEL478]|uniref:ubiquitinyl hydrolase 1 n=1 Tax=Gonapodya prolifera (strain JEL478) TaxID=1344416 RepID=A0A139AK64_GONPJ|nr:hypothetical protein M427DRAFT_285457 [Gonapodya prolifera JEL478]|eukprot:KXS16815.1 hypothetical protein M427DRAFT_285457 [Gonapodya prolifera JEL478]